ncbi:MAG TPA: ABC transporter permease, partial [bacterium]
MTRYLARRALHLIPVVLGAAVLAFALLLLVPGDPAIALLGQDASVEELARFRHLLGLDRPLLVQLGLYLARTVRGDLGRSVTLDVPVLRLITSTLPATLELALLSLILAIGIGIPLGLVAARRRGRAIDTATMLLAQLGVSMPVFWLGVLLILLFAVRLNVLPSFGRGPALIPALLTGNGRAVVDALSHLALPSFTL